MSDSTSPIVRLRSIEKSFREGSETRSVLRGVHMDINSGELVVLLGRSGAGKSTLLNIIGGLDVPDRGSVVVGETDIGVTSERERTLFRRSHIGFVFQSYNLIPTLTVLENILLPIELSGKSGNVMKSRAVALLERVGLGGRETTFPDLLSGGEQQRVAIARALVHEPMVVLADEPTGNLDFRTGRAVMELFTDLVREQGTTMLVVTHDSDFLERADRLMAMREGLVVQVSSREEAVPD